MCIAKMLVTIIVPEMVKPLQFVITETANIAFTKRSSRVCYIGSIR